MKEILLYEQLTKALLAELASGLYGAGQRFLSQRKICRRWKISEPTAKSALRSLVNRQLIEARHRSGYFVRPRSQKHALLLLSRMRTPPLPPQSGWESRRFELRARLRTAPRPRTVAVILTGPPETPLRVHDLSKAPLVRSFGCIDGIFQVAAHQQIGLEFFVDNGKQKRRDLIARQILDLKPDGVIAFRRLVSYVPLQPLLSALVKADLPIVTVFDDCEGLPVHSINLNNVAMGYEVARRFIRRGHRHMAVLLPEKSGDYFGDRAAGCEQAWHEADLPPDGLSVLSLPVDRSCAPRLRKLLRHPRQRPTALFLTTAAFLPDAWRVLKQFRAPIPRDVSLIVTAGVKRIPEVPRAVDTVLIDFPKIGRLALNTLLAVLAGKAVDRSTFVAVAYAAQGTVSSRTRV